MGQNLIVCEPLAQAELTEPPLMEWCGGTHETDVTFHHVCSSYIIRFKDLVDFCLPIDDISTPVTGTRVPGVSVSTVHYLYDNLVRPLHLTEQGAVVMHGSAVVSAAGALVFLAQSGYGKSTLVSYLASHGYPLLTDDSFVLSLAQVGTLVHPGPAAVRLWDDSLQALQLQGGSYQPGGDYTSKNQVSALGRLPSSDIPAPLAAVYLLGDGSALAPTLCPLQGAAAFIGISEHQFFLPVENKEKHSTHFLLSGDLFRGIPVWQLDYPRTYSELAQVAALLPSVPSGSASGVDA